VPEDRPAGTMRARSRGKARSSCDGAGLLGAFRAAAANLAAHVDEVNALNVFPVPDGDTGSNMLATVQAALHEAEALGPEGTVERIAGAAAFGALMGARGNSGVIASQILRGIAEALAGRTRVTAIDVANALEAGTRAAYGAVAAPVEGTILTVIRAASVAAVASAEHERSIEILLRATVEAAHAAVARTPDLLPILREAGVVDSGGQGLARLLEGALAYAAGEAPQPAAASSGGLVPGGLAPGTSDGFGYETMYLLQPQPATPLDVAAVRRRLESMGDSVLVAGDAAALRVHIHSDQPDEVIRYGLSVGILSRISVENLDHQARAAQERGAATFAFPAGESGPSGNGSAGPVRAGAPALAVIAVAAGDGLAAIFRDFGVQEVVMGGATASPSTRELLEAVASTKAQEVLILPNNPNVLLVARQVAALADRPVGIVATRNAAEGFAALLALDPTRGALENAIAMTAAGRALQTLSITRAVRDATLAGRLVRSGQWIALDPDDGVVAAAEDPDEVLLAGVAVLRPGFELITLYYGGDADLAATEDLARRIRASVPTAEIEVVHGGQPHYRYLLSAE
jgi:uncharacterized protein